MSELVLPDIAAQGCGQFPPGNDRDRSVFLVKNALINGDFGLWHRGSRFLVEGYGADRWRLMPGDGTCTVSRQAREPEMPLGGGYFYRHDQTEAASGAHEFLEQRVAGVRWFANCKISLSVWARAEKPANYHVALRQHFGCDGVASADAKLAKQRFFVGTELQKFTFLFDVPSISGKTLGVAGNDYLSVAIESPGAVPFTFDLFQAQLETGSAATPFEPRPKVIEELLAAPTCQVIPARVVKGLIWISFPVPARSSMPRVTASVGRVIEATRLGALISHESNAATEILVSDEI